LKTVSQDQVDSTIQSTRWNNFSWSWAGRVCRAGGRHTQVSSHTGVLRCQSFTISDQRWIQQVYTVGDSLFSRFNRITRLGLGCTSLRIHWQWRARYSGASDRFAVVPEPDTGGYFPAIYRKQRANLKKKKKIRWGTPPRESLPWPQTLRSVLISPRLIPPMDYGYRGGKKNCSVKATSWAFQTCRSLPLEDRLFNQKLWKTVLTKLASPNPTTLKSPWWRGYFTNYELWNSTFQPINELVYSWSIESSMVTS
jgi:hypothetical protein